MCCFIERLNVDLSDVEIEITETAYMKVSEATLSISKKTYVLEVCISRLMILEPAIPLWRLCVRFVPII